jgi:hypothetical protein
LYAPNILNECDALGVPNASKENLSQIVSFLNNYNFLAGPEGLGRKPSKDGHNATKWWVWWDGRQI